jgi:MFS family permease
MDRRFRVFTGFTVNKVIRFFVLSDFTILFAFGVLSPIFAVFLTDNIQSGNVEVVGFAATVMLLFRSAVQIPVAVLMDKIAGEKDDFWLCFGGTLGFSFIPIAYIFARSPAQIYVIQAVYGVFLGITYPSWSAIFTRHIDHHEEGFEWALYTTVTGVGMAAAAAVGGVVAATLGFDVLFIGISVLSLLGSFLLIPTYSMMRSS